MDFFLSSFPKIYSNPPPPTDWRRHFFNWTGDGVLDTCVQKIFRYYWCRTGATTSDAAISAPLVVPLIKLNMRYEGMSHNKFSIGSGVTSQNWTGASATVTPSHRLALLSPRGRSGATAKTGLAHKEFPYMEILHREIPYREKWRHC